MGEYPSLHDVYIYLYFRAVFLSRRQVVLGFKNLEGMLCFVFGVYVTSVLLVTKLFLQWI